MENTDVRSNLTEWMRQHGWNPQSSGSMGELWGPENPADEVLVSVPYKFGQFDRAFDVVIDRVANFSQVAPEDLKQELLNWNVDKTLIIAKVPIDNSLGMPTAGLTEISHLFSGAGRLFTSATDQLKSHLAPEFTVDRLRAGMTEVGSYALPVYVQLSDIIQSNSLIAAPTPERLITKTVAKALTSISQLIIEPDNEDPTFDEMRQMQNDGVTYELLGAVSELMSSESSDARTSFSWAPSHAQLLSEKNLPIAVDLPHEARELIRNVAKDFRAKQPEVRAFFGRIVGILYVSGAPTVTTVMAVPRANVTEPTPATEYNGRVNVVHHLDIESRIQTFYDWNRNGQLVEFGGFVSQTSEGRTIENPTSFDAKPLQTHLD